MIQTFLVFSGIANVFLRLIVGLIFVAHGWRKAKNYSSTKEWFSGLGFKPGWFWATLVLVAELAGGLAILLGLLTQVFALILSVVMVVAFFVNIFKKRPFIGALELDLIVLASLLMLATLGSGAYSLDSFFGLIF